MNKRKCLLFLLGFIKTVRFNLHYFPLKTAVRCPILLTQYVTLKKLGGTVKLECPIKRGVVSIGYTAVSISNTKEQSVWNVEGEVIFKGNANFGAGTKIAVGKGAKLTIGKEFNITGKSAIACFKQISFGEGCLLSWDVLIMDTDSHQVFNEKGVRINEDKPIIIGNKVWIGCRSLILKGTEIPDGCIVAAQSVLNDRFNESRCVLAGQPARVVKHNIYW